MNCTYLLSKLVLFASVVSPEAYPEVFKNIALNCLYQVTSINRIGFGFQLVNVMPDMRQFIIDGHQICSILCGLFSDVVNVIGPILDKRK
ncbi:hypothetical protein NW756_008427 [Fusarium oxysporum]|nr:hypothetical protein NW763_014033 [Fusarium oxysporum]KAJ4039844.1 hypothetical protein NW753_010879 [Fusarium oxysporum]KAJ4085046.1 hypothetical protein NW756_008427 [Fusarium oxysporum]